MQFANATRRIIELVLLSPVSLEALFWENR